jgi:hypothetical protein
VRRRLVLLGALAVLALAPTHAVHAQEATVTTTEEGWYAPPPTCALPLGCGPTAGLPPVSRYPAGTLHVGATAGVEDARTYLRLDLDAVPAGASLTGGTLTVPLAGSDAGTAAPESAQAQACFATAAFAPVEGALDPPPPIDCSTTSPVAVTGTELRVDLTPFAARWAAGELNNGIALVPAPVAPAATWHLAFGAHTASAVLDYHVGGGPAPAAEPSVVPEVETEVDPGLASPGLSLTPAPPSPAAAIVQQAEQPEQLAEPVFTVSGPGFAYPVVMALPLVLLVLGGYLGWALTRPVVVAAEA